MPQAQEPDQEPGDGQPDQGAALWEPQGEPDPRFRLDPARLPRRFDLTLSPELTERLQELATRSGRDLEELIIEALDRGIGPRRDGRAGGSAWPVDHPGDAIPPSDV